MPVGEVIQSLKTTGFSEQLLAQLTKLLRNDEVRSSNLIKSNLFFLILGFNKILKAEIKASQDQVKSSSSLVVQVFKTTINLLAANDANRDYLTDSLSDDVVEFWELVNKLYDLDEEYPSAITTLLGQFIYETDNQDRYMRFLHLQNLGRIVYHEFQKFTEMDLAYYFVTTNRNNLDTMDQKFVSYVSDNFEDLYEKHADTEDKEKLVDLLEFSQPSLTTFNASLKLLGEEKESRLLKKLMVATSNVFTNNVEDLSLEQLNTKNPYGFAACCICIGNTIHDDASRLEVAKRIDVDELLETFFTKFKVTDIVQLQAIHVWVNLLDETISKKILETYSAEVSSLIKLTMDNATYYKEIASLCYKFVGKLIKFSEGNLPESLIEQLVYHHDANSPSLTYTNYFLLQKASSNNINDKLFNRLISNCIEKLNSFDILEQLKTIAIFNDQLIHKKISLSFSDLNKVYLEPLEKILSLLYTELQQTDTQSWNQKIFENNLKYVAATTVKVINGSDKASLIKICEQILQKAIQSEKDLNEQ